MKRSRLSRIRETSDGGQGNTSATPKEFSHRAILASHFMYDGFGFHLQEWVGDVALFSKSKHGRDFYEVVIVKELPAKTIFGRAYPIRQALPPPGSWGTDGWSLATLERAREKFAQIVRSRREASFSLGRTAVDAFLGRVCVS